MGNSHYIRRKSNAKDFAPVLLLRRAAFCLALLVSSLPAFSQSTNEDAVSRELSVFNMLANTTSYDTVSREVSVFNVALSSNSVDVASREVSVFNSSQNAFSYDVASREVSLFNIGQSTNSNDVASREVSVFNLGQPAVRVEAISRELSFLISTNSLADLIPAVVSVPATGIGDATVQVVFAVTNAGKTAALGPWLNQVLLAPNTNGAAAQSLGTFTFGGILAAGASTTVTQTVILPPSAAGTEYLGLFVDSGNYVPEINKSNNTVFAASATAISAADLAIENLNAPSAAQFGESIVLSFAVTNIGTYSAAAAWNDQLYLSTSPGTVAGATLLSTIAGASPLATGAGYTRTQSVMLPLSSGLSAGAYYIVGVVDALNAQPEISKTNNILSIPISLSLPPLPDLAVTEVIAPATAISGSNITLIWAVTNQGNLNITNAAWSEAVGITNASGTASAFATFRYTNSLNAGDFLTRTNLVLLPGATAAGNMDFFVTVNSLGDIIESNPSNNTTFATNLTTVPAGLLLVSPVVSVAENTTSPNLACLVSRNGNLGAAVVVSLASSATNHMVVPTTVTIPAGAPSAPFTATVLDDGIVDSNASVAISAQATGFLSATTQVEVINTDVAALSLSLSPSQINEGATTLATVTSDIVSSQPAVVSISSSSASALTIPSSVTIPAYSNSTTFAVTANQNTIIAPPQTYAITVSAPGYVSASSNLTVLNINTPTITLLLDRTNASETDGPLAAIATVSRQPVTDQPLTVALVSTNPAAAIVPAQVVISPFEGSASFYVAAVNDTNATGPKTTLIVAQALDIVSNAVGNPATEPLTVQDANGPLLTLRIANKVVAKGLKPATTAVVSRNTPPTNDLVVTISCSNPAEATVPAQVTIPTGQTNVVFDVISLDDGTPGTSQSVCLTASATNYASGSDVFAVTDLQLPDLVITNVTAPAAVFTGQPASISFALVNQGLGDLANGATENIYLSTDPSSGVRNLVGSISFAGSLAPGQYAELSLVVSASAMPPPGIYWVLVTANADAMVLESNPANDTGVSAVPMAVSIEYTAMVQAGVTNVPAGTPVPLSGSATLIQGGPAANVQVNLIITVNGIPRVLGVYTDANGNFSTLFTPLAAEAGSYTVTAVPPGINSGPVQAQFNILGITASASSMTLSPVAGASASNSVVLQNRSAIPLTGLTATVNGLASNLMASVTLSSNAVGSQGVLTLGCTVTAADSSIPTSGFSIHVASIEGAVFDLLVTVTVVPLTAQLVVSPGQLNTTMLVGGQTVVQLYVANVGGLASGPLTVALPNVSWLSVSSPNPMPSLNPGQSNLVSLVLTPPATLALGPYTGSVAISGTGVGVQIPFAFDAVSDEHGSLLVQSVDEFTFFAAGAPPLTNASVTLTDPFSKAIVASGVTDTNGLFFAAGLMAGAYSLSVSATQHATFNGSAIVTGGRTNNIQTFLSRQTVSYTWTVVPTQIQDQANITVQAVFEANVPAPVVVPTPASLDLSPLTQPGQFMDVPFTLANYGLIAVENVSINISQNPLYRFDLVSTSLGTLPAHGTVTVPMRITRVGALTSAAARGSGSTSQAGAGSGGRPRDIGGDCSITFTVNYFYPCGPYGVGSGVGVPVFNVAGSCNPAGGGDVVIVGGPGGGGPWVFPPATATPSSCDPCTLNRLLALAKCILSFIPIPIDTLQCFREGFECAQGIDESCIKKFEPTCGVAADQCILAGIECSGAAGKEFVEKIPWLGWGLNLIQCSYDICTACEELGYEGFCGLDGPPGGSPSVKRDQSVGVEADAIFAPLFAQAIDMQTLIAPYEYFFGDSWLRVTDTNALLTLINQFDADAQTNSDGGQLISDTERSAILSLPLPAPLTTSIVSAFLDRWNLTTSNYAAGIYLVSQVPRGASTNFIDFEEWESLWNAAATVLQTYQNHGLGDPGAAWVQTRNSLLAEFESGSTGTCAQITLQIDQNAVLTRNAFRATLQLTDSGANPLTNISVSLVIQNSAGQDVTSLFGIVPPVMSGGLNAVGGTGALAGNSTGSAQWTLVPTIDAAPRASTNYVVGGTLSYTQGGTLVTIPLAPAPITVQPSPQLYLKYFLQRDVYGDDPYTPQIEPSVPFPLAVMVQNRGYGPAYNFQITSAQPKIVDNKKGLLIGFNIIGSQVDGQPEAPSLTVNFGDLLPNQAGIGIWYMTCSLDGQFINYQATFQNVTSLGNTNLSVFDGLEIHPMTHLVRADGAWDDGLPDFLVNDIPNLANLPDTLYLSSGQIEPVSVVQSGNVSGPVSAGNLQVQLTADFPAGFTYVLVPDPAAGQFPLQRVQYANGTNFLTNNFWMTDRTFEGIGEPPVLQTNLSLLVYHTNAGLDTFTLVYGAATNTTVTNPPVSSVFALPATSPPTFGVVWNGAPYAGGASIAYFDIYVSDNGGPFTDWQSQTTATSALYNGSNGHTYAFYSIATDTAGHREATPLQPQAQTTVVLNTNPPTVSVASDVTLTAGQTLSLGVTASDPNPLNSLTFSLGPGAPTGVSVNPATGLITWPTSPTFGGTTNLINVIATDNGQPPLSATGTVQVILLAVVNPPVLNAISNRTIFEASRLVITNTATDNNLPPKPLTFSLGPGAPASAGINASSGVFQWLPTASQAPSTNVISVIVADNSAPPLSATQQFTVVVRSVAAEYVLGIGSTNVFTGSSNSVAVTLQTSLPLTNVTANLQVPTTLLSNLSLQAVSPEIISTVVQLTGANEYAINMTLNPALSPGTARTLAQLGFTATAQPHSAIVTLVPSQLLALQLGGSIAAKPGTASGRVFIIGNEPLLDVDLSFGRNLSLTLYGELGTNYEVQWSSGLSLGGSWQPLTNLTLANAFEFIGVGQATNDTMFYRALKP